MCERRRRNFCSCKVLYWDIYLPKWAAAGENFLGFKVLYKEMYYTQWAAAGENFLGSKVLYKEIYYTELAPQAKILELQIINNRQLYTKRK